MSFLPVYKASVAGLLLATLFLWKIEFLPVVTALLILSIVFFWFDLLNTGLHYESAFWLFILSEVMAFGSLLVCCFWFETCSYVKLSRPTEIPFLGCFLLLGSSITVTGYHHTLFWKYSWILLFLTIALGISFIILQMYEMKEIIISLVDSSYHASRFCVIGLHFRHVLLGVVGLSIIFLLGAVAAGSYRCTLITWYWHFVDYIWLFVYAFVYVCFTGRLFKLANCGFVDYFSIICTSKYMLSIIRKNLVDLPTNYSLSYYWCRGFMISLFMVFQVITGAVLSFLYVADSELRFRCVMDLTNDSFFTWCVRYWHIWGVTILFMLFFVHMGRALYYSSYTKKGVWNVGFTLYLITMAEAFLGYILPWHQMSYWAATVLTAIVQSLPFVGPSVYKYVVGGFSVTKVTLVRVFSAHVCLGFVILGLMVIHLFYLHSSGSNNPLFSSFGYGDVVYFHSYFTVKDLFLLIIMSLVLVGFLLIRPDLVVDTEGYLEADALTTPVNIKPEWYFLIYYAMLRSVDSKIGGLVLVIRLLFFLWVPTFNGSSSYSILRQLTFWSICSLFISLTYLGACHPEYPYLLVCKTFSFMIVAFMFIFKLFWSAYPIRSVKR